MNGIDRPHHSSAELDAAVHDLLFEAISQDLERRDQQREPFLAVAKIHLDDGTGASRDCFTRDVSNEGIGLMHAFPLDCQDVVVEIDCPFRQRARLRVNIEWCRPFSEGWYISGGGFVGRID